LVGSEYSSYTNTVPDHWHYPVDKQGQISRFRYKIPSFTAQSKQKSMQKKQTKKNNHKKNKIAA